MYTYTHIQLLHVFVYIIISIIYMNTCVYISIYIYRERDT